MIPILFTTVDLVLLGEENVHDFAVTVLDEGSNISYGQCIPIFRQADLTIISGDRQQLLPYTPLDLSGKCVASPPADFWRFLGNDALHRPDFQQVVQLRADCLLCVLDFCCAKSVPCVPLCIQFRMSNTVTKLAHRVFGIFLLSAVPPAAEDEHKPLRLITVKGANRTRRGVQVRFQLRRDRGSF